jgi:hypothetical protein
VASGPAPVRAARRRRGEHATSSSAATVTCR